MKIQNFIDGKFTPPSEDKYLDIYEPATGEVYGQLPDSDEMDVAKAVQAARKAFPRWAKKSAEERAAILYKIADLVDEKSQFLAEAESKDQGKPVWLAKSVDIKRVALNFRFFAGAILHDQEEAAIKGNELLSYTLKQPVGVCGLISPWNLPLYLLTWKMAPALACGNTIVCKPSEFTSATAYLLAQILIEAGLPDGVCNIVFGTGPRAGSVIVEHPMVEAISFTGGTATGQKVLEGAAPHFKKVSLELGGKNPNIIFKDADLNKRVETTIRSSFLNSGQICLCGSRIYVQEAIYEEFLAKFKEETEKLIIGDPNDEKTFMGPLVSQQHLDKVLNCISRVRDDKGVVLTGGERLELGGRLKGGYFLKPTIIVDLNRCSELMQEEFFGPVVTVTPFKSIKEVVEWSNNCRYGLSASVWTQDISKAHRVAAQLQVGTVWINTWMARDLRMPFGGVKASGLGREGGKHSLDFFTETKTIGLSL